ncbi:hypothetical protein LguiB_015095 [Lonicera macranthoides]
MKSSNVSENGKSPEKKRKKQQKKKKRKSPNTRALAGGAAIEESRIQIYRSQLSRERK